MTENLMRPSKILSYEKKIFNYRLTLARRYVKCTFGIMCNKWRILHRPPDVKIDLAETIVKAICALHNYVRVRDGFNYENRHTQHQYQILVQPILAVMYVMLI